MAHTLTPVNDQTAAALGSMRLRALDAYPAEHARIDRGHALALMGGVDVHGDGTASVLSQTFPDTWYTVNGHCICRDASVAPGGRCKHRWAKALLTKAYTHLVQHSEEPLDHLPAPYDFPQWTHYEASYVGVGEPHAGLNGVAIVTEPGRFYFIPEGETLGFECSYADVALGPGISA